MGPLIKAMKEMVQDDNIEEIENLEMKIDSKWFLPLKNQDFCNFLIF